MAMTIMFVMLNNIFNHIVTYNFVVATTIIVKQSLKTRNIAKLNIIDRYVQNYTPSITMMN